MAGYRVHVLPWLRHPGRLLLRDWLAITLGRHILAWRPLTAPELAHELAHVAQWRRYGLSLPWRYLVAGLRSWRAGSGWYRGNRFEVEARAAVSEGPGRSATPSDPPPRA